MSLKDKVLAQPEHTRRRLALGATVVICLFIFTLWLGQTSHTVAITLGDAQKVGEEAPAANSPFRVIKNLGSALTGIFTTLQSPPTAPEEPSPTAVVEATSTATTTIQQ